MGKRFSYWLLGFVVGLVCAGAISALKGDGWLPMTVTHWLIGFNAGNVAMWIAERRGKVESMAELRKPLTLFPLEAASK